MTTNTLYEQTIHNVYIFHGKSKRGLFCLAAMKVPRKPSDKSATWRGKFELSKFHLQEGERGEDKKVPFALVIKKSCKKLEASFMVGGCHMIQDIRKASCKRQRGAQ